MSLDGKNSLTTWASSLVATEKELKDISNGRYLKLCPGGSNAPFFTVRFSLIRLLIVVERNGVLFKLLFPELALRGSYQYYDDCDLLWHHPIVAACRHQVTNLSLQLRAL